MIIRPVFRLLVAVLALVASSLALAEPVWMSVLLDGRKIGSSETRRVVNDGVVETTQVLRVRFNRGGEPLDLLSRVASRETVGGEPIGFDARLEMSSVATVAEGERLPDGRLRVARSVAGQNSTDTLAWPHEAVLFEGQRMAMRRAADTPGTPVRLRFYDPASGRVATSEIVMLGREPVRLPEGTSNLIHLRQSLLLSDNAQSMELWVNDDFDILKGVTRMLGYEMTMQACSRECAEAPYQDIDLLRQSMVFSPRRYNKQMLREGVQFLIRIAADSDVHFIETGEQLVTRMSDDLWRLSIGPARRSSELPPAPADTVANEWVQADHPEIVEAAHKAVGSAATARRQMPRLKEFVRRHLGDNGLGVGYASALEALRSGKGDCTENALLLTAMARALGIPARTVSGLVYVEHYAGASRVFIPHMWTQAWVDGRWRSYDAALGRFDSSHIALAVGDGEPWRYFSTLDVLAHLRIERITSDGELLDSAPTLIDPPAMAPAPSGGSGADGGM